MSDNPRSEIAVEYFDVTRLPTVEMNGPAIKYVVSNAGTLTFITVIMDHIGFAVADQTDKIWWPLASITNVKGVGPADDSAIWRVRVWLRDVEDPNLYIMSSASFEKLTQEWSSYHS